MFLKSEKIRLLVIAFWIILYLFCFESFLHIGDSLSSDLIYIESLYRDLFISNYSMSGWLVSKSPYYFPDWFLYALVRSISGNYITGWYVYIFINFLLILAFFYYTLRYFYREGRANYVLFTLTWGIFLIALLLSSPKGYGPHTFLFPVYHSGAMLSGLFIMAVWLHSIKNRLSNIQKIGLIIVVLMSTMSDLWTIIWFVVPIFLTTMILIVFKKLNLNKNLIYLSLLCASVFIGAMINPLLEKFGYLHFSHVPVGEQHSILKNLFKDLGELFLSSPLLVVFFTTTIYVAVTSVISSRIDRGEAIPKLFNIDTNDRVPHLAMHGAVILSFITSILVIIIFKLWGGWNYRYLHPIIIFPWLITGLYVFNIIRLNKRLNEALNIFYYAFPILALSYLFTISHDSSFSPSRRGVPMAWLNPAYPQDIACIDNVARLYDLDNGISEYWNAKKITELNRTGLLVNQFDYNLNLLHWMNNLEWYKVKSNNGKDYVEYDFIVTETVGGDELKKNTEINFGIPSAKMVCGNWTVLIYKDEKKEKVNTIIRRNLDKFFILNNNLISQPSVKLFDSGRDSGDSLRSWHFYPEVSLEKTKILSFKPKENNVPQNLSNYIRFVVDDDTNYAFLEKHLKIDDIAGKNIMVTFLVRAPFRMTVASSIGYLVPEGKLDESAIFFFPTQASTYKISSEWERIDLKFSVPSIDKSKISKNSYALIRPVFIDHQVTNLTIDIADVKLFVEEHVQNFQETSKIPVADTVDETSKYITISDYYANTNQILEEYRAIKTIEMISNDNHEVLWRLSRVHMRLANTSETIEEKNINIIAAASYAFRAIGISSNVDTLKWWGITAEELGKIEGHNQYIAGSKIFFDNLRRAIDLEPQNPELLYLLGRWNYNWASRDFFWSSKLQGSYDNAKNLFIMAVKLEPRNVIYRLWLAATLMKLNDEKEANFYYLSAVEIGIKTDAEIDLLNNLLTNLNKK